jgi:hypothetical protein
MFLGQAQLSYDSLGAAGIPELVVRAGRLDDTPYCCVPRIGNRRRCWSGGVSKSGLRRLDLEGEESGEADLDLRCLWREKIETPHVVSYEG